MILVGTRGWAREAWVGSFYPVGTDSAEMLPLYSSAFRTVEVGSTFFEVPTETEVVEWRDSVPSPFRFSVDVPKHITHDNQLRGGRRILNRLLSRMELLGDCMGPFLIKTSPLFVRTADNLMVLEEFCRSLSRSFRWAIEFRRAEWLSEDVLEMLARFDIAVALAVARWIRPSRLRGLMAAPTTDFVYLRWIEPWKPEHPLGSEPKLIGSDFADWRDELGTLRESGLTVLAYFGDRFGESAPESAREFQRFIGQRPVGPVA